MEVILTPLAEKKLDLLLLYLDLEWGTSAKLKFLETLEKKFDSLTNQPYSCQKTNLYPDLFNCVISKQTSAIYHVDNERQVVYIVTILIIVKNQIIFERN
jgi:plasmid stabilization system protein ParE